MASTDDPRKLPFPESGYEILAAGLRIIEKIDLVKLVDDPQFNQDFINNFSECVQLLIKTKYGFDSFGGFVEVLVVISSNKSSKYETFCNNSEKIAGLLELFMKEDLQTVNLHEVRQFWWNLRRCFHASARQWV
jgi:hypothetical protein